MQIFEPEEEIDIQATINELKKLEKERQEIDIQVKANLKELGYTVQDATDSTGQTRIQTDTTWGNTSRMGFGYNETGS